MITVSSSELSSPDTGQISDGQITEQKAHTAEAVIEGYRQKECDS